MKSPNQDQKSVENTEWPKPQASACGPACSCHGTGSVGRIRKVLGVILLLILLALVARAVIRSQGTSGESADATFVLPTSVAATDNTAPASSVKTLVSTELNAGKSLASLSDLNTVAAAANAVFVYVPGSEETSASAPMALIQSVAGRIGAQGYKTGFFTLDKGSRDYAQLSTQVHVPVVLAMVKGRGTAIVSGDITETNLVQGFLSAANASCCSPGNCGPAGCGPMGSAPATK